MSITSWLSQRYFSTHVANSTLSTLSGALPLPTKEVKAMTTLRSSSMERPITILKVSILACKVPLMLFLLRSFWKHVGSLGCGPSLRGASPCGWSGGFRGRTSLLREGASAQGEQGQQQPYHLSNMSWINKTNQLPRNIHMHGARLYSKPLSTHFRRNRKSCRWEACSLWSLSWQWVPVSSRLLLESFQWDKN